MKKVWCFVLSAVLLAGCGAQSAMETVADELDVPVMASPRQVIVDLPQEAEIAAMESENGRLFLCDDYTVSIETMSSGDLDATLKSLTGRGEDSITLVQTQQGSCTRYDFVWAGTDDDGEFTGRGSILDDGVYHYCLSLVRPLERLNSSQVVWKQVFNSFSVG